MNKYKKILSLFRKSIEKLFIKDISYVSYSGSFAYQGAKKKRSDLDILLVFDNKAINQAKKEKIINKIALFVIDYVKIHQNFDYIPDLEFPGEYVTQNQISDALRGRGFSVNSEQDLFLPYASNEYYLDNANSWFRAWLSMTCFSKFLMGNKEKFLKNKLSAWNTILLYTIPKLKLQQFDAETILDEMLKSADKWSEVGVTRNYVTFKLDEYKYVNAALIELNKKGYIDTSGKSYRANLGKISSWNKSVAQNIMTNKFGNSGFLVDKKSEENLSTIAKQIYEIC